MAQPDLTSPTYTVAPDTAPSSNGKQWYVSALGGTQSGVAANLVSHPFTLSVFRPTSTKLYSGGVESLAGMVPEAPKNTYKALARKAVAINASGGYSMCTMRFELDVPVGAPVADPVSLQACLSLLGGALTQDTSAWPTMWESGSI